MKSLFSKAFVIALFMTCLTLVIGCTFKQGDWAPTHIQNKKIVYYIEKSGDPVDVRILHRPITYIFHEDGRYSSSLEDGSVYALGDYSYYKVSAKESHLTLTYPMKNNLYTYDCVMTYESPTSGKWYADLSSNPEDHGREYGTFEYAQ